MKERPILFSAPMVRAILEGTKTQTRRVVKLPGYTIDERDNGAPWPHCSTWSHGDNGSPWAACPYGAPGDRLWVRETWQAIHVSVDPETGYGDDAWHAKKIPKSDEDGHWVAAYAATDPAANDHKDDRGFPWRPGIHMPRWSSRITLAVESVRVERLHDITEADARAEGITDGGCVNCGNPEPCNCTCPAPSARDSFISLWSEINGIESWSANPWVWCVSFSRVT